jgi:hypothetical protein
MPHIDAVFLRKMMIAKLEEFKLHYGKYQEAIGQDVNRVRLHLQPHELDEFERFLQHNPDLDAKAEALIQEIEKMVTGFTSFWRLAQVHEEQEELISGDGLTCYFDGVAVSRTHLPHGSTVRSIGYNTAAGALDVEFHTGKVYRYFDVPQAVVTQISAERTGATIQSMIRGKYRYECIRK